MYTIVLLVAGLVLSCSGQYQQNAKNAAILSDARYLSGDGTFGAAYTQEDGVQFKEETDADGNRRGAYSYVDPSGVRRTVSYTAGKNGFQASGDHLPQAPPQPIPVAPQPQYQPQPQYNPPAQPQYQPQQYQPQPQQYQPQPQQYQPQQYQPQPSYNAIPQYPTTTPPPHRFYPPGKLDLNRTPDGFSYSFSKN